MRALKAFFVAILVIVSVGGCGLLRRQKMQDVPYGASMRILYNRDFTRHQFDSICEADTIPSDLKLWKRYSTKDFETDSVIVEHLYIKRLGVNEEIFRLMVKGDDRYNIYKRVTYGDKEE